MERDPLGRENRGTGKRGLHLRGRPMGFKPALKNMRGGGPSIKKLTGGRRELSREAIPEKFST